MKTFNSQIITQKILSKSKYKNLLPEVVESAVIEASKKYKPKEIESEASKLLHQTFGAFGGYGLDYEKYLNELNLSKNNNEELKIKLKEIMNLHASTKERVEHLEEVYRNIFSKVENVNSILDIACGFNPLSIPWMNLSENVKYTAFDIDKQMMRFVDDGLKMVYPNNSYSIFAKNIFDFEFPEVDVTFAFKALQTFETIKKGSAKEILQKLKTKYLVISYPIKSLSGKNKGMSDHYKNFTEEILRDTFETISEFELGVERYLIILNLKF